MCVSLAEEHATNCRILLCDFFGGSAVQERSYNGIQSDPRAAQPYYAVGSLNERYRLARQVSAIDSSLSLSTVNILFTVDSCLLFCIALYLLRLLIVSPRTTLLVHALLLLVV